MAIVQLWIKNKLQVLKNVLLKRIMYLPLVLIFVMTGVVLGLAGIHMWQYRGQQLQQCTRDYASVERVRNAANHTTSTTYLYADVDSVELYATPLYDDPHLLAYYRLENNTDSKGTYNLKDRLKDGLPSFQTAEFNNGSDSGSNWQTNIGKYNADFALSGGITPVSISAWVSINSQPPYGLDGDFVEVPIKNHTVDYALGYGWFGGEKQIFFSRARLGLIADRNTYPFTMIPSVSYHLVGTWDGTGNLNLYLNGVNVASLKEVSTGDGYTDSAAAGLGINGTWSGKSTIQGGVGGRIDDVAIFDRVLAPTDIHLLEGEM